MYKVKMFGESSRKLLEEDINSWLENNIFQLIDIKYVIAEKNDGHMYQYAMIIYKEDKSE